MRVTKKTILNLIYIIQNMSLEYSFPSDHLVLPRDLLLKLQVSTDVLGPPESISCLSFLEGDGHSRSGWSQEPHQDPILDVHPRTNTLHSYCFFARWSSHEDMSSW